MRGFKVFLIGIFGVLFLGGLVHMFAAQAESNTPMRSVSGKISSIDVKLGLLKLNSDAGQDTRGITKYRINQDETRVTDPSDKKFLVIKDLRAGQHVTLVLVDGLNETMVRKIITEPQAEPVYREMSGEFQAMNMQSGTLAIVQDPLSGEERKGESTYFVFEPNNIVMMQTPSRQPVQLGLNPGDPVKVEYVEKDGKLHAHSVMLLKTAPEAASTTTTTTTTSTTVTP